jgi:hypothetical protein
MEYEQLEFAYRTAMQVCDPLAFMNRQKNLLHVLAEYMLDKDKPIPEEKDE